jgi:hypothetical protein
MAQWQFDTFEWLLRQAGGLERLGRTPLVLPNDEFFPDKGLRGAQGVRVLFDRVRGHAGMSDWPCRLEAQEPDPELRVGDHVRVEHSHQAPAGTFSRHGSRHSAPVITYDPQTAGDPMALVATFAHELAHYLCSRFSTPPPGGEAMLEPATDLAAVYLGFGVFLANSAFRFQQFSGHGSQGWRAQRLGYLGQSEILYSLAIFCALRGVQPNLMAPHLDRHLYSVLKRAFREVVGATDRLQALRVQV